MSDMTGEAAEARRERRAQAIWTVQGAGLPWSSLTAAERETWYALADAVEASDRDVGVGTVLHQGSADPGGGKAPPGLRAHAPAAAVLQDLTRDARAGAPLRHDPGPAAPEGRVSAVARSLMALVLFLAAAAGLLYLGFALVR
ncbi:MAG: hypothetical protein GVY11_08280 [Gammaproteobacteria bacterium]|jgi:hypothetical protein|nr:hypothetical protein [Gammaproteobacteria bacterium]